MVYRKFFAIVFCVALFAQGIAQTKPADKPPEYKLSPELEGKALSLLNNLARDAEQFYLAENRVFSRSEIADLMWEYDEKTARAIFQNAVTDMISMVGQLAAANYDENTGEGYTEQYRVSSLRSDLLITIAGRDPKFALDSLKALSAKDAEGNDLFADDKTLELSLAEQIAEKDPNQAYELAKKNLEGDINQGVFSALEQIYKKDADIGIKLAKDIVAKIKERKLTSPFDYAGNTNTKPANVPAVASEVSPVNVWQVQNFLDTVRKLNRLAAKEKKTPVLSETEFKSLIEMLGQKYLNQSYLSAYEISRTMPDIVKYFPATAQAIKRKLAANPGGGDLDGQMRSQAIDDEIEDKTYEEIVALIEKKPVADRDEFYRRAAEKVLNEGDVPRAKELYGKIKKKPEYDYMEERLNSELPLALAMRGDLGATREMLAELKTPEERIEVLTSLAVAIAGKGDKKTAGALIDEARAIYSGKMKKRKNLASVIQIGYAYSAVEPPQSFTMIESNLSFVNDIIAAAIMLDEFNEMGSVENDEVRLEIVESESYRNLRNGVSMIRSLAAADFERLTNLADRFQRSETRFFARYRIAEALLNANALESEKEMYTQSEERYYEH